MRQPIDITFNVDAGYPVAITTPTVDSKGYGRAYAYNANIIRITCIDDNGDAKDLSGVTAWRAGYGTLGTGAALVAIANAAINQVTDWADADPATGKLCAQLDLSGSSFLAYIGTATSKSDLYLDLQSDRGDGLGWQTVLQMRIVAYNTVLHPVA